MPYISVIIPVYNRTQYVGEAINSVFSQTLHREKYELIIVTNVDLLEKEGVRIIKSKDKWQGPKFAQAIEEAKGEVISLLDDDDLFLPNKLEVVYKVFKENEKLGLLKNPIKWVNEQGKEWLDPLPREPITLASKDLNLDKLSEAIRYKVWFNSSSLSFRKRDILNYIDYLKEVKLVIDAFIGLLFLFTTQVVIWNQPLSVYRVLSTSTSRKLSSLDQYIEHKRTLERIAYEDYVTLYNALKSAGFEKILEKIINYQKIIVKLWSKEPVKLNLKEALNSLSLDNPKASKFEILSLYLASSLPYFMKKTVYKKFYKKELKKLRL